VHSQSQATHFNRNNMNTKQQLDEIQKAIDAIRENLGLNHSEKPNSSEPDYTRLLPEGYEFCTEQDAEKWVKVEMRPDSINPRQIGRLSSGICIPDFWKPYYRPIRQIKYHVAIHETVTAEPDPYQVDWEKAPEGSVAHFYDSNKLGLWHKIVLNQSATTLVQKVEYSFYTLPSGLDWKQSLRVNPKLK